MPTSNERSHTDPVCTAPLMPEGGRYAGQPVDARSRRSIEIHTNNDQTPIGSDDAVAVVDNFYHAGVFWKAVIPLDGVHEVLGQAFNFSKAKTKGRGNRSEIVRDKQGLPKRQIPTLNHLQSRFKLKPDVFVELHPIDGEPEGNPTHRINDFVYSVEAVGPLGTLFNFWDGVAGNFISAHRFLSTQEMVFERIVVEDQYVTETAALPVDDLQRRTLLIKSLLRSHRASMNEKYYLYRLWGTNNCTSTPFQILDKVMDYNLLQRIGSLLYRLPLNPRFYLWIRGLDSEPSVRKLLRNEFSEFINNPATQERKRKLADGLTNVVSK